MNKLAVFFLWLLVAIPLRDGLLYGEVIGAGPDVVSTLWGMWWFQQEGISALLGQQSELANYPNGVHGSVLSPSSALLWALLEPLFRVGRALALVVWLQLGAFAWATAFLTKNLGVSAPWHWTAALVVIGSRYLFFGVGEASIVAVVALSIPLGCIALQRIIEGGFVLHYQIMLIAMIAWTALENPYLAPILPGIIVLVGLHQVEHRKTLGFTLFVGMLTLISIAQSFGEGANPEYPREVAGQVVSLFGKEWDVVDLPWARLRLEELIWPMEIQWTTGAENATLATGGRYIGVISLGLAIVGGVVHRTGRYFFIMAVLCCIVSLGSVQYNLALPFLLLNSLMDAVARPLTQPTRFLAVALLGFAVASSFGLQYLKEKQSRIGLMGILLLLLEGVVLGGLGLRPPTTKIPTLSCVIENEKGVLVWPYDALDGELGASQLYQMRHGRPSAQTGIASWKLVGERSLEKVRGAGFSVGTTGVNERRLIDAGFDAVLVEKGADFPVDVSRGVDCGDAVLVSLQRREGEVR